MIGSKAIRNKSGYVKQLVYITSRRVRNESPTAVQEINEMMNYFDELINDFTMLLTQEELDH